MTVIYIIVVSSLPFLLFSVEVSAKNKQTFASLCRRFSLKSECSSPDLLCLLIQWHKHFIVLLGCWSLKRVVLFEIRVRCFYFQSKSKKHFSAIQSLKKNPLWGVLQMPLKPESPPKFAVANSPLSLFQDRQTQAEELPALLSLQFSHGVFHLCLDSMIWYMKRNQ